MNAGFFGAIAAVVVATMFLDQIPWDIRMFLGLWLLILGLVNYAFDHSEDANRVSKMLKRRDGPFLYTGAVQGLLGFLQRVISPKTAEDEPIPESGLQKRLDWWMTPRAVDTQDLEDLRENPWSWPVFNFTLKISVVYPILFAFAQWIITGQDTGLGEVVLFPAYENELLRYLAMTPVIVTLVVSVLAMATGRQVFKQATEVLLVVMLIGAGGFAAYFLYVSDSVAAGAGASAFAVALAVALSASFEGVMLITIASGVALVGTGPFVGASIGPPIMVLAIVGAGAGWVSYLSQKKNGGSAFVTLAVALLALLFLFASIFQFDNSNAVGRSTFLFLGLFPIINSLFDFLSYGLTIHLIRSGLRQKNIWSFFYGGVDLFAALILFFILSVALVGAVAIVNRVSETTVYDLENLFLGIRSNPHGYYWVFGMVFSTLIPTVIHLYIVALSILTWLPSKFRLWLETGIASRDKSGQRFALASIGVATVWTLYAFVITLGIIRLALWAAGYGKMVGWWYLDKIEAVARVLGAA